MRPSAPAETTQISRSCTAAEALRGASAAAPPSARIDASASRQLSCAAPMKNGVPASAGSAPRPATRPQRGAPGAPARPCRPRRTASANASAWARRSAGLAHLDAQPGRQQQVVQVLQRLHARQLVPHQPEMAMRLGRIAQPLVDGVDPHAPEAEGVGGIALAGFGGGELARLAPGGRRGLRQQRHHVDPADGRRGQVLAPPDLRADDLPGRLETAGALLPVAFDHGEHRTHQLGIAAVEIGTQRPGARQVAAVQQRLGQAQPRGRRHHGRCLLQMAPAASLPAARTWVSANPLSTTIIRSARSACKAGSSRSKSSASKGCSTARRNAPLHRCVKV